MAKKKATNSVASEGDETPVAVAVAPVPDPAPGPESIDLEPTDTRSNLCARIATHLDSPAGAIGRRQASRQEAGQAIELLREALELLRG